MTPIAGRAVIEADADAAAHRAARWLAERIAAAPARFRLALSGGSTPRLLYRLLASDRVRIDWTRLELFWGDERFVPANDPLSNSHMAWTAMLSRVSVLASRVHAIPTEGLSVEQSASVYETELQKFYGGDRLDPERPLFDLVLLGLGIDGHTASLFPGSPALEEREHWTAPVTTQRPKRITLTCTALESSAHMAFLVTGAEKRAPLRGLLNGEQDLPAARLHPRGELRFFVDAAAAS